MWSTSFGGLLLPGRDAILDGGQSTVGVESSIVDCTGPAPVILRPGAVTAQEVARVGGVPIAERPSPVRAPGTLASHYAPRARVVVVTDPNALATQTGTATRTGTGATPGTATRTGTGATPGTAPHAPGSNGPLDGLLAPAEVNTPAGVVRLSAPADAADYARVLYAALREADALGLGRVLAVPPPADGVGAAVLDRLRRAAATKPERGEREPATPERGEREPATPERGEREPATPERA